MEYRTSKVFVPGGMPQLTYVPRNAIKLEPRLRYAVHNLHKLITVTGQTKSGKTVLVNTVLPRADAERHIWLDGGGYSDENDFWTAILQELGGGTEHSDEESSDTTTHLNGGVSGSVGIPGFGAKASSGTGVSRRRSRAHSKSLSLTPRAAALRELRTFDGAIIIDDFHYLDRKFQGNLVRALKPLIFDGLRVVAIAIPHRRYDAVRVEREMTGRIENIEVPTWTEEELQEISSTGFPLLNMRVIPSIGQSFASQAYGSPHLMQEFCQRLAISHGIERTADKAVDIKMIDETLYREAAEGTGKVIYDKLSRGPRQRSDRIQRDLVKGGTADIYGVVLLALSKLAPGLETVEYEQIRTAIRNVLAGAIPQAHEVTRVLERMAEIAASDESSTPVIDWDKEDQKLHITDPFFAFYLKWGTVSQ